MRIVRISRILKFDLESLHTALVLKLLSDPSVIINYASKKIEVDVNEKWIMVSGETEWIQNLENEAT